MLSKYDPVLIGHDIQNDLIEVMAKDIHKTIIKKIKLAKYYPIIVDCVSDTSHQELLTIIIRVIDMDMEN